MNIDKIREAVKRKFDYYMPENFDYERAIVRGIDDPGQWSPNAIAIIYTEMGFPSDYNPRIFDMWMDLGDETDLLFEPVNSAVMAVYR